MSTQSIVINNLENKQDYFERRLLDLGDNLMMNKRFMIGEAVDRGEINFVKSFYKLLCTNNCELIDYVNKKIRGKLQECDVIIDKKPKISDLFKIYQQQVKDCDITEITGDCCNWEQIEW